MKDRISANGTLCLAVIGLGERATHMARMVCEADPEARVTAVVDPRGQDAIEPALRSGLADADRIRICPTLESLIDHADLFDGLMIGTPCNLHSATAVKVARTGLPVFLEKPVAISWSQLAALAQAYLGRESSVVVSFPLRLTDHVRTACEVLQSGRLGTINQVQAVNNVSYGGVYFGQWYREYEKAGGLWLQKATHDFDYINCLMSAASRGVRPVAITAMHSRTVYGGTLPADLRCSTCSHTTECPESPVNLTLRGNDGGILNYAKPDLSSDHACAFSQSIRNQDAGSAIIMYSDGAHAAYSQNFLTRASAGRRGVTITGYHATLQFDWQNDAVTVFDHFRDNVERIKIEARGNHGGGDLALARNFVDVMRGRDASRSPLNQGLLSAAMCLAARDSTASGSNQTIANFDSASDRLADINPRGPIEPPPVEAAAFRPSISLPNRNGIESPR